MRHSCPWIATICFLLAAATAACDPQQQTGSKQAHGLLVDLLAGPQAKSEIIASILRLHPREYWVGIGASTPGHSSLTPRIRKRYAYFGLRQALLEVLASPQVNLQLGPTYGFDYQILRLPASEPQYRPSLIVYDKTHMSSDEFHATNLRLESHGYSVEQVSSDQNIAVLVKH